MSVAENFVGLSDGSTHTYPTEKTAVELIFGELDRVESYGGNGGLQTARVKASTEWYKERVTSFSFRWQLGVCRLTRNVHHDKKTRLVCQSVDNYLRKEF